VAILNSEKPFLAHGDQPTETLDVTISFPNGIWGKDAFGNFLNNTVFFRIEYRESLATSWISNDYSITDNREQIDPKIYAYSVALGTYDVRVSRLSADQDGIKQESLMELDSIKESISEALAYPNQILLAIQAFKESQLQDSMNILATISYDPLPSLESTLLEGFSSSNPAAVALDILKNQIYGGKSLKYHPESFQDFALYCDQEIAVGVPRWAFNGVFDSSSKIWESINLALSSARGFATILNGVYRVIRENFVFDALQGNPQTHLFTIANIEEGSMQMRVQSALNRKSQIEASFINENLDYKPDSVISSTNLASLGSSDLDIQNISLFGITRKDQAQNWVNSERALLDNIYREFSFIAFTDALSLKVGDRIDICHPIANHPSVGGRIKEVISTSKIILDRAVLQEAGKIYELKILFPFIERDSGTISNVEVSSIGYKISLSGFSGTGTSCSRLVAEKDGQTIDAKIISVGDVYVNVADSRFEIGMPYKIYDTDVLDSRIVLLNPGLNAEIDVQLEFSVLPERGFLYAFGEEDTSTIPCRVLSINLNPSLKIPIKAVQLGDCAQLSANLISYWNLDELSGSRKDAVSQNHLSVVNPGNVLAVAGKQGYAVDLVPITDYVGGYLKNDAATATGTGAFSIAGWFFLNSYHPLGDNARTIIAKWNQLGSAKEYGINVPAATNKLKFAISENGSNEINLNSGIALSLGTWFFFVAWFDGSKIYLQINNGIIEVGPSASSIFSGSAPLYIGSINGFFNPDSPWHGKLDAMGYWKRALSAKERKCLWNMGAGKQFPF
jgi:hypothetical protein